MAGVAYGIVLTRLSEANGGGFAAFVPDLPNCISDGETAEQATANVADAVRCWIAEAVELGRSIQQPSFADGVAQVMAIA